MSYVHESVHLELSQGGLLNDCVNYLTISSEEYGDWASIT